MATLYRFLREITAEEAKHAAENAPDSFVESIRSMRAAGNVPDLSEPSDVPANDRGSVPDMSEPAQPHDPDVPRCEDYEGRADAYLRDSAAHKAIPLSHLTVAQRRERFASGQRG